MVLLPPPVSRLQACPQPTPHSSRHLSHLFTSEEALPPSPASSRGIAAVCLPTRRWAMRCFCVCGLTHLPLYPSAPHARPLPCLPSPPPFRLQPPADKVVGDAALLHYTWGSQIKGPLDSRTKVVGDASLLHYTWGSQIKVGVVG
ncbi:unnamed protein product, partial [Closterium sp. NIES-54]